MKKLFFLAIVASFLIVSCGKPVTAVDPNYIGSWSGSDGSVSYALYIGGDDQGSWNKFNGSTNTWAEGKVTINGSGTKLKIGFKGLSIDQAPTLDSGTGYWTMILDGVTYYK